MKIYKPEYAIYNDNGITFGNGHDIFISDNSNSNTNSYSNLGSTYKLDGYVDGSNDANRFLAGSYNFRVKEIEVFQQV